MHDQGSTIKIVHRFGFLHSLTHRKPYRCGANLNLVKLRFSLQFSVLGNDMYLYSIDRDLAKSTFTHVPCGTTWKGREKMVEHLSQCAAEMTQDLDEIYQIPGLPNVTLTFGWALFFDGLWHNEVREYFF